MQIPFADAVLGRLGRREAGLELIEDIEDEALESVDARPAVGRAGPAAATNGKPAHPTSARRTGRAER